MQTPLRTTIEETHAVTGRRNTLLPGQMAVLIILGIAFWFAAAMTVLYGSPLGFFGPAASMITFILVIPVCWFSVLVCKRIARLERGQTLPGIAIGLATATFSDAIALTWGRELYGSDPVFVVLGAAWILWGVGLFLLFAYLDDYRQVGETR